MAKKNSSNKKADQSIRKSEEKLNKHGDFQQLISNISNKFVGLTGVEFELAIQDTLEEIGRYFESDTVRLYRLSLQGDVLKIRNQWQDKHLAPPEEMAEIHTMKYPNLAAHYSKGEATVFSKFDDSPKWPEMRKILKFFGTKAGVGVPLEVDSSGVDVFAMDKVRSEHVWPEDIVEQSKAIGKVILSAMRRRETEVELQSSYDEIKLLKERLEVENVYLREQISVQSTHKDIIGKSDTMKYVLYKIKQVAPSDATVLILGETGTGKELVAEAIHNESSRRNRPLVKVNCAALPSNLIESELFGREKGAFTGSQERQIGRFELADKGTIFLDEVGELPLELQAKLLRVIQSGEFERLGSPHTIKVDVRIIASTNRHMMNEVKKGQFREDLYYRLNVFPITVPPLRKRTEDIPMLVQFFLKKYGKKIGKQIERVPYDVIKELQKYQWPGNVRELANIIERSMIISPNSTLHLEDKLDTSKTTDDGILQSKSLSEMERDHILSVLEQTKWKIDGKNGAAEILDLNSSTLRTRMRKLGIQRSVKSK
jgi:transcriptional regulator with GAF, ATPase, and Fis domain